MTTTLTREQWTARRSAHEARVDRWTGPAHERAARQQTHPVEDFLFTYYSHRRGHLHRWSPGPGVVLADAELDDQPGPWIEAPGGIVLDAPPERLTRTAAWIADLLTRTASRPPTFGCFGLHEWAMVHGAGQSDVRHASWPLRLGSEGTTAVVESVPVRCSHFDAFRFFTPTSRQLNLLQPTRETQGEMEQGGCLHANMDLYKWSYKLSPWIAAELVADCFDLARRVRTLDMRASPYDLQALGYAPVPIETPEGRAAYAVAQRDFAAEAAVLRERVRAAAHEVAGLAPRTSDAQAVAGNGHVEQRGAVGM